MEFYKVRFREQNSTLNAPKLNRFVGVTGIFKGDYGRKDFRIRRFRHTAWNLRRYFTLPWLPTSLYIPHRKGVALDTSMQWSLSKIIQTVRLPLHTPSIYRLEIWFQQFASHPASFTYLHEWSRVHYRTSLVESLHCSDCTVHRNSQTALRGGDSIDKISYWKSYLKSYQK